MTRKPTLGTKDESPRVCQLTYWQRTSVRHYLEHGTFLVSSGCPLVGEGESADCVHRRKPSDGRSEPQLNGRTRDAQTPSLGASPTILRFSSTLVALVLQLLPLS